MQIVEVYRARSAAEAHLMCGILNDSGILTRIEGEELYTMSGCSAPYDRIDWSLCPRIIVSDSQAQEARKIIDRLERERKSKR